MAIDQLIFTPIGIVLFYSVFKTLEGRPWSIQSTIREKFFPTLFAGYAVWPIAHIINFRFIPTQQRVLYINVITVSQAVMTSYPCSSIGHSCYPQNLSSLGILLKRS